MKIIATFLITVLFAVPTFAQLQPPDDQLQQQFEDELNYLSDVYGYGVPESMAYVEGRLQGMTEAANMPPPEGELYGLFGEVGKPDPRFQLNNFNACIFNGTTNCSTSYNVGLLQATAISTGLLAGCAAVTVVRRANSCAATIFVSHVAQVWAAYLTFNQCNRNVSYNCRIEGFR